tara:strand:- start:248 stop:502 length:255 start_codon:yes stop_codon:yes gene_type:complete
VTPNKVRESIFIGQDGEFYIPRPTSWGQGMLRERWFKNLAKMTTTIASPPFWEQLVNENNIKTLVEYDDQTWEIIEDNKRLDKH